MRDPNWKSCAKLTQLYQQTLLSSDRTRFGDKDCWARRYRRPTIAEVESSIACRKQNAVGNVSEAAGRPPDN